MYSPIMPKIIRLMLPKNTIVKVEGISKDYVKKIHNKKKNYDLKNLKGSYKIFL